jgi:hypothetical protein
MLFLLMFIMTACQVQGAIDFGLHPSHGIDHRQMPDAPIMTMDANSPPIIVSTPPLEAYVEEKYSYPLEVYDKDGDLLTFGLKLSPIGMKIQAVFGVIEWIPTAGQVGNNRVIVTVTDAIDTAEQDFNITVMKKGTPHNFPPSINSTPVTTAQVGNVYNYQVFANDTEDDSLTYHLNMCPTGMKVNAQTGLIYWVPLESDVGRPKVVVTASDGHGSGSQWFYISVTSSNHKPTIISSPITSAEVGKKYRYMIGASDPDASDTITFGLQSGPASMKVNNMTGELTWTPKASQKGKSMVVVTATDGKSEAVQTYTISVKDKAQEQMVLMAWLSVGIVIVIVSVILSVILLKRRQLQRIAEEKRAMEARLAPPPPPWMMSEEEKIIRTAPDRTISSTIKDVLDETLKDLGQGSGRTEPGRTLPAAPKPGYTNVPMLREVVPERPRQTVTIKVPEIREMRVPLAPRPHMTDTPAPPIKKRLEHEVALVPRKVKTQPGSGPSSPSDASSANDIIDRILTKTKADRTKEQGTGGPPIPKARAKAIAKMGKEVNLGGGPTVAPPRNVVVGPSYARVLSGLNRSPRPLPAELWGKKKEELAKAIAGGTYARGDHGEVVVRLGKRWYYGDPEEPSTYLSRYEGRTR